MDSEQFHPTFKKCKLSIVWERHNVVNFSHLCNASNAGSSAIWKNTVKVRKMWLVKNDQTIYKELYQLKIS